jgi:hypothetical protein
MAAARGLRQVLPVQTTSIFAAISGKRSEGAKAPTRMTEVAASGATRTSVDSRPTLQGPPSTTRSGAARPLKARTTDGASVAASWPDRFALVPLNRAAREPEDGAGHRGFRNAHRHRVGFGADHERQRAGPETTREPNGARRGSLVKSGKSRGVRNEERKALLRRAVLDRENARDRVLIGGATAEPVDRFGRQRDHTSARRARGSGFDEGGIGGDPRIGA